MCLEHIRLSLPGTNSLGQASLFIPSTYLLYNVQLCLGFSWYLETCKKRNSIHLNSYTLFSCILRKIIISTSPWQPGSKNRKDCPILLIYQRIKGCCCKLFLEHPGLNLNLCNSNKFTNSVCLSKGWTFIFFKGGEKICGRYLAVNGMSMQVGGGSRRHLQGEGKFTN